MRGESYKLPSKETMTTYCLFHKNEHDHYEWKNYGSDWVCKDALDEMEASIPEPEFSFSIGTSSKSSRMSHWKEIKSRVTTHEGQILSGKEGREYQQKYSKRMLGADLSRPVDFSAPDFQKELAKTK